MDQISLQAYAKVNLTLDVVGRREDGYHLLSSIMQSLSLSDTITLHKRPRGIKIKSEASGLPLNQMNICWQAAEAFQKETQIRGGVLISLEKTIPMAAGLGGGSADAAAVLVGLNHLFGTGLSLEELQAIGVQVGADVPFCLQGGTCLVEGIGERVQTIKSFPATFFVLVKPNVGMSTAEVYRRLPLQAHGERFTKPFLQLLEQAAMPNELGLGFGNALEEVTREILPEIVTWQKRLSDQGALGTLMSGSGSTCFGLFSEEKPARQFQERWGKEATIFIAQPVPYGVQARNGGDLL